MRTLFREMMEPGKIYQSGRVDSESVLITTIFSFTSALILHQRIKPSILLCLVLINQKVVYKVICKQVFVLKKVNC